MCRSLGYEYMAITDHSPHSAATRNLTVDGVKRRPKRLPRSATLYPDIAILHGCEVDILPDGRLDFPDRVLERFDIVLASLHERAGHDPEQLMKRYVAAMKHPLVTLITHPTNRLVPSRAGYDLDYDRLFEAAVETQTVVEIDGAPSHLDLDGALARRAIAAGATVAIDSDCHRAEMLDRQMDLGIITARRGWVEPRHVLNTRPLDDVRAAIARKRAGQLAPRAVAEVAASDWPPSSPRWRVRALPRHAASRLRLRRHRLVSDDGRRLESDAARRLPAVLRDRRSVSSGHRRRPGARAEPGVGDRGGDRRAA